MSVFTHFGKYAQEWKPTHTFKHLASITDIQSASATRDVRKKYKSTNTTLGKGAFGTVILFIERATNKKVAIKIILKESLSAQEMGFLRSEIQILSQLDHPHIIKYKECFEDTRYLFLVMDFIEEAQELGTLVRNRIEAIKKQDKE